VLLTEDEVQRQTVTWNTVEAPYELNEGYVERFRRQAALTPQAVALVCGTDSLTYRELDRRSNALALRLRARGVGPERLVAVLDQRDLPLAVALLAILKAGGAYLPLDPSQPLSRLRQMIRQSGCAFVLTGEPFAARLHSVLDDVPAGERPAWEVLNATEEAAEGPELPWQGERLAYVIYTSGSTGLPKGVMVEHRGMLNHLLAKVAALDLHPSDCVAQNASQCFDISIWQLLAAWLVGARVHLFPDQQAHQPAELLAEVQRGGVTVLELVPSLLRALLDLLEQGQMALPTELRWLIATGEALPADLCQRWLALVPQIPLLNAYGPTECSDEVTHLEITAGELRGPVAPLGYPLPNTRLYVLDAAQQLVPVGVSGELWIGGVGVGRGYLNDPRRTAEAFRPDPFGPPGQRLYRTGDLVRARPDGQMEFLGRIDQQIKLRGYRIELGEIEAALRKHPSVRDCVVILRNDGKSEARLLAYVVLDRQNLPKRGEVLDFLSEHLPEYMVPHTFIILDALPLNSRGKIDRKALLPPEESDFTLETLTYVAPRTPLEQTLAAIWAEVLEIGRVGVEDNFFEIGGHSLLIAQILGRVRDQYQLELPFRTIFTSPTIAALAGVIERVQKREAELRRPAMVAVARDAYRLRTQER
ncbi:MAG TPA: amino acid adenylation domain-containing protein, partial [Ktedonobacteraceae bacterium]|nr:amino acid adenylation domain-containing protein [Ktedonobacteraceae bacterium]